MKFPSVFILLFTIVSVIGCKKSDETSALIQQQQQQQTQELETAVIAENETTDVPAELVVEEEVKEEEAEIIKEEAEKVVNRKRAKLTFNEKEYDYGMIYQGDVVQHDFSFTNTGDANLVIKSADATCGCTTPKYSFMPIKPGETGKIGVTFNSTGKLGTHKPMITLVTNASPRVHRIYLTGFVNAGPVEKPSLIESDVEINPEENVAKGVEEEVTKENEEEVIDNQ